MSIQRYMTVFTLMRKVHRADAMGGLAETRVPVGAFLGGVTQSSVSEIAPGGVMAVKSRGVMLHLPVVLLHVGDEVVRNHDGATFRVLSESSDMTMPRKEGLHQVQVERVVSGQ